MTSEIKAPVLFLVFNRPEKTRQVFDVIKSVRPSKLYVAADGPRVSVPADQENCLKVREIVRQIDWECDPEFLFHEKNLGCSLAGKTAWDWIFSQEDEMIFIEDDGLVSKSFFWFCQELLELYRNDKRIAYITGENFGPKYGPYSYFFSRIGGGTLSMATWKRVHELYEFKLESYLTTKNEIAFKKSFVNRLAYEIECARFDNFIKNGGNTYDLQMWYMENKHNLLCINPNTNLCSNIGFDPGGTNCAVDINSELAKKFGNRLRFEITELVHPPIVSIDKSFERDYYRIRLGQGLPWIIIGLEYYFNNYFPILGKIYRKLIRTLKH